ncbi:MAG TPA: hypothetical protein VFP69_20655 [Streptomyces sp.]|nr:hypothetical protein [Streptomyces sp.]
MGAWERNWRGALAAAGFAAVTATGVVACDPGGLSAGTVAYTTDQTVTRELERQKADVRWLTCRGTYADDVKSLPTADEKAVATVDCEGETGDDKDISVKGKVTRSVRGACVRGDLTAKVDGKVWFRVDGLGKCDATPPPVADGPDDRPGGGGAGPAATVTVTRTVWCRERPDCAPVEGK